MKKLVSLALIVTFTLLFLGSSFTLMSKGEMKDSSVCASHCLVTNYDNSLKVTFTKDNLSLFLLVTSVLISLIALKSLSLTFLDLTDPSPPKLFKLYSHLLN